MNTVSNVFYPANLSHKNNGKVISCRRRAATVRLRTAASSAEQESRNLAPPPSYLIVMEEGLPSYEEAVMVRMKQDVVEDYLPSYEEAYAVEEVGTKMITLGEVFEENLDVVKVVEVGTEMTVLEEALDEVLEEALNEVKVAEEISTTVVEGENL